MKSDVCGSLVFSNPVTNTQCTCEENSTYSITIHDNAHLEQSEESVPHIIAKE